MMRRGPGLYALGGVVAAFLCVSAERASARDYGYMLVRAYVGASSESAANAEPLGFEMGGGKLIGGSVGATAGDYWRLGLKGESIAREEDRGRRFRVASLSVWVDRKLSSLGPLRLGAELDLGTAVVEVGRSFLDYAFWSGYGYPWSSGRHQFGLLIQPGATVGWHPVGFVEFFGTLGYRWTSVDRIDASEGHDLFVDGKPITANLNGPVAFVGITLFVPWSGPVPPESGRGGP